MKFFNAMRRAERINANEKVALRETNAPVEIDLFIQQLLWEKNSEFLCHMSPSQSCFGSFGGLTIARGMHGSGRRAADARGDFRGWSEGYMRA